MRVVGLVGRSGSGKTTLIRSLLPLLQAQGLRVSTLKHTHKALQLDQPGKDSALHRAAGAYETLVAGGAGWALHGGSSDDLPDVEALLARLAPVDLVLVEGFRGSVPVRAEICRAERMSEPQGEPLWHSDRGISVVVTDAPDVIRVQGWQGAILPLDAPDEVAAWVVAHAQRWLGETDQA